MPQQWRLDLYRRSCAGATPEQLQREFGLPAEEIALKVEAARLCFEKQCLVASLRNAENLGISGTEVRSQRVAAGGAARG